MTLIVGFDTEFTRQAPENSLSETDGNRNRVLSYQLYFLDIDTGRGSGLVLPVINGHKRTGRITLGTLLGKGLEFAKHEGIIKEIPAKIILAAHFWRADLPALRDFPTLKGKVDAVRRTYASAKRPFIKNAYVHGRAHRLSITMVDTMLLAPAGYQSLAALGDLLGIEKIQLPHGAIEHMDRLQAKDPDLFKRYALRDAEIAAKWVMTISKFFQCDMGINVSARLPITLGAAAVKMFLGMLDESELKALLGNRHGGRGGKRPQGRHENLSDHMSFFANGYHGGRNEAYVVGYHTGHLTDIDLCGAYTTAMAAIRYPDWDRLTETTDLDILAQPDALSIARVLFHFPGSTRFPSLPVRAGARGLIYPLEGIWYCTGAELRVALDQDAQLEVQAGVYVPWASDKRPFLQFTRRIAELRKSDAKGSALERVAKEVGNSLYGKVAQGVANMRGDRGSCAGDRRRQFNAREGKMEDLDPSKITQPLLAAFITGLVRAVLSEMLARLPRHTNVLTATTDGFLSDAQPAQLDNTGPLASLFSKLREMATGDPKPIEVKGEAAVAIVMKTRGAFATKPLDLAEPGKPILARAGTKLEKKFDDPWNECRELEALYRDRHFDLKLTQRRMINLRLQWLTESDLVDNEQEVRVNLDYDLKRRPIEVTDVNGIVWFKTDPWQTVEEFNEHRNAFENWRSKKRRVLRTAQDWDDFLRYKDETALKAETGVRTNKRPPIVQLFLRCYAHGLIGLPGRDFAQAARFVTEFGWPTTAQNIKDAKRRGKPKLGVIGGVSDAEYDFLTEARRRWPGFDYTALLKPGTDLVSETNEGR